MSFWCLQISRTTNKISLRISALASKKRSNQKMKGTLYHYLDFKTISEKGECYFKKELYPSAVRMAMCSYWSSYIVLFVRSVYMNVRIVTIWLDSAQPLLAIFFNDFRPIVIGQRQENGITRHEFVIFLQAKFRVKCMKWTLDELSTAR
jgi:hypothetical protein